MKTSDQLKLQIMKSDLEAWAVFRKSSDFDHLSYPSQSAEQSEFGTSSAVDPAYEREILIDSAIEKMPIEYRRILYAAYSIPLKLKVLDVCKISHKKMYFSKRTGLFYFPENMQETFIVLRIKRPTFYNLLRCGKAWFLGRIYD